MGTVKHLHTALNTPERLRWLADAIERGEFEPRVTLISGTEVFNFGSPQDLAAQEAIWHMTYGIHKLMMAANGCTGDD